jgi:hypothetical protein
MFIPFSKLFIYLILIIPFISFAQNVENNDSIPKKELHAKTPKSVSGIQKRTHYKPHFIANLPEIIKETSGLLFFNGQLWTINDSGNPPEISQVDTSTGNVLRTVVIRNSVNTDWESITQDDSNVYIGDFGNNAGNRTDLHILKIAKTDLINLSSDTVQAGFIHFSYPDQTDFATAFYKNNFDCEAFFCHKDSLHLFSKDWVDLQTKHYVLPSDTGIYQARLVEKFSANGLITDASINEKGNIVLLGYKNTGGKFYSCFIWLLSGYKSCFYFSGISRRIELGSALHLGQTEGIALKNNNTAWLSSESILIGKMNRPAKLFRLELNSFY